MRSVPTGQGNRATHALARAAVMTFALACLWPATLQAMPPNSGMSGDAGFDDFFREGEQQSSRGDFLGAARTWSKARTHLPADDHENRRNLYVYIAEAYEKAVDGHADRAVVEEAVTVLDDYAATFATDHPGSSLNPDGVRIHDRLRARLVELQRVSAHPEGPQPLAQGEGPQPPATDTRSRPWKGLMIGGGVVTGLGVVMLGVFAGGYLLTTARENDFNHETNKCSWGALDENCRNIRERGERADVAAVVGLAAAPVLLGAGAVMLGIAARRKSSRQALAPVVSPAMAGVVWLRAF